MMGDKNARLGRLTGDRDIHGKIKTNMNKALFLEFLKYSGMYLPNTIYTRGQPTYEILDQKRYIIDLCLANSLTTILAFEVLPQILGASAQTCHKVLKLRLRSKEDIKEEPTNEAEKFRHCENMDVLKVKRDVAK